MSTQLLDPPVTTPMSTMSSTSPRKVLIGLIGAGIQKSLSPALHEEEARHHGMRLHYQLIDLDRSASSVEHLPTLLSAARIMGYAGCNVTYPCKQAVIPHLDSLSEEARAMGAVNTVVIRDGQLVGHNTDGSGWAWGFTRALPGADLTSNTEGEYSEYWEEIASSVDVVSDCNSSTVTAAKAICAREGVEAVEQD